MKKLFGILVLGLFLVGPSYGAEDNTVTIDTTKVKNFLKSISGKILKKNDKKKFLNEFAITIEDERGNGVVTYVFDEENYKRYKDFKVISDDAWRFSKIGQLRLFNTDIKLTWKIKLGKENTINIKAKYSPLGKFYPFTYEPKADYLAKVEDFYNKEIAEKEREKQKKLEAIEKNRPFIARVGEALSRRLVDREASPHLEKQIYDGFPGRNDQALMEGFHEEGWSSRISLIEKMEDLRLVEFAYRLVYFEKYNSSRGDCP